MMGDVAGNCCAVENAQRCQKREISLNQLFSVPVAFGNTLQIFACLRTVEVVWLKIYFEDEYLPVKPSSPLKFYQSMRFFCHEVSFKVNCYC